MNWPDMRAMSDTFTTRAHGRGRGEGGEGASRAFVRAREETWTTKGRGIPVVSARLS